MKRIGSKLFIGFLCMAILTVSLLWLIQAVFMKDNYLNERVRVIDNALKSATQDTDIDYQSLESGLNISLFTIDNTGEVIYTSQGLPMRGMMLRQSLNMIDQTKYGKLQYLQNTSMNNRYALISDPLPDGGIIFAVFSLVDVEEASRILLQQLWIITIVLLVVSVLISVILAQMFSKPILKVTQAAREMTKGKLGVSLPVNSKDEIGQLTEALNELGSELQKTEDLRRELIANVSHELRAPLSVIQGFAETVRDVSWPNEEKRTTQLTIISDEASRLSNIVGDILDYSKLQANVDQLSVSEFSICPVLDETLKYYDLEAKKKNLSLHLDCIDEVVRFDQGKFKQVLNNLLNNALNHAETGSTVLITVTNINGTTRVSVANTGKPIPTEELKYIWDRYYRADHINDNRPMGTGLGLSIVKSIFEHHNVAYGVTSDNNETVFWFDTLPK